MQVKVLSGSNTVLHGRCSSSSCSDETHGLWKYMAAGGRDEQVVVRKVTSESLWGDFNAVREGKKDKVVKEAY